MPIHLRENQYRGVNAHLHSFFQNHGDWEGFHEKHITHLADRLDSLLPANYYAINESSLQISGYDLDKDSDVRTSANADIAVYQSERSQQPFGVATAFAPTATLPVAETIILDDDFEFLSVVIYQVQESNRIPVTRIELLSPGNNPPQAHYRQYVARRAKTLESAIRLVELDYLHQSRSPIDILPSYPHGEPKAYPYWILVSDPRPNLQDELPKIFGFNVDEPIPTISIPLAGEDIVTVDFNEVYNQTFGSNRYYSMIVVDYEQEPLHFEIYTEADQTRIRQRMAAVTAAQQT